MKGDLSIKTISGISLIYLKRTTPVSSCCSQRSDLILSIKAKSFLNKKPQTKYKMNFKSLQMWRNQSKPSCMMLSITIKQKWVVKLPEIIESRSGKSWAIMVDLICSFLLLICLKLVLARMSYFLKLFSIILI